MAEDDTDQTRIILALRKKGRTLNLQPQGMLAWIVPAFLAGVGLTLLIVRWLLDLKVLETPGLIALILAKALSKIWDTRYKQRLDPDSPMGCSPFVRLVWSGFFLLVLYFFWGTSSRFHPVLLLLLILSGANFLAVVAELVAPSWAPPGVRPPAQRMLFDAPTVEEEPPAPTPGERAAYQERDSRSGFVVLILALLVMLGLVAYFALHGP